VVRFCSSILCFFSVFLFFLCVSLKKSAYHRNGSLGSTPLLACAFGFAVGWLPMLLPLDQYSSWVDLDLQQQTLSFILFSPPHQILNKDTYRVSLASPQVLQSHCGHPHSHLRPHCPYDGDDGDGGDDDGDDACPSCLPLLSLQKKV